MTAKRKELNSQYLVSDTAYTKADMKNVSGEEPVPKGTGCHTSTMSQVAVSKGLAATEFSVRKKLSAQPM